MLAGILSLAVEFSDVLAAWLDASGMNQSVVAGRTGLKPNKLSELVTGRNRNPTWKTIARIADAFGVEPVAFFAGPTLKVAVEEPGTRSVDVDGHNGASAQGVQDSADARALAEAARDAIALASAVTKELALVRAQLRRCEARQRQP